MPRNVIGVILRPFVPSLIRLWDKYHWNWIFKFYEFLFEDEWIEIDNADEDSEIWHFANLQD